MQTWPWRMRASLRWAALLPRKLSQKVQCWLLGSVALSAPILAGSALGRDCKEPTGALFLRPQAALSLPSTVRSPAAGGAPPV